MTRHHRLGLILIVAGAVLLLGSGPLLAAVPPAKTGVESCRGPGFYFSEVKLFFCLLVFISWVWTTDWVNRDAKAMHLDRRRWNPVVFGPFLAGCLLFALIPWFWLGFPLLLMAYILPLGTYVVDRNERVDDVDKVLTRRHLRWMAAEWLGKVGIKLDHERPDPFSLGAPVNLVPRGGADDRANNVRLLAARQSPGLPVRARCSPMRWPIGRWRSCSTSPSRASPCVTWSMACGWPGKAAIGRAPIRRWSR